MHSMQDITSAEDVDSSLVIAADASATEIEVSGEEDSTKNIEEINDAENDLNDAEEVDSVDAIETLVEEILHLDSQIEADEDGTNISLQLEKLIKKSQLDRDLWEKSSRLPL